ncbi:MAG: cytochrome b5 domain-containing protein [Nitrospirota bacterium]
MAAVSRIILLTILFITAVTLPALATPEYSDRAGQGCMTCHLSDEGGGKLTTKGLEYAASGYTWPPEGGYRVLGPIGKSVRLGIGLLHIVASFIWFGAILYVHILLRPGYASRGMPKAEVALGLTSMIVVGITGTLLAISRIKSADVLIMSHWGNVLLIKMVLYVTMISSALFTIIFVGPKLRRTCVKACIPQNNVFDPVTLSAFDGKNGAPAYVACKGKVYDVSMLKLWKDGVHMKHLAGSDLTDAIAKSPHGEGKLEKLTIVGTYDAALTPKKTFAQKAFYFIAYMNLFLVFVVLFVIAYWRWGL